MARPGAHPSPLPRPLSRYWPIRYFLCAAFPARVIHEEDVKLQMHYAQAQVEDGEVEDSEQVTQLGNRGA